MFEQIVQNMSLGEWITLTATLIGFVAYITRLHDKITKTSKDVEGFKPTIIQHHNRLEDIETKQKDIDDTKKALNVLCRAVSALLDHEINGDMEELKKAKKELDSQKEII